MWLIGRYNHNKQQTEFLCSDGENWSIDVSDDLEIFIVELKAIREAQKLGSEVFVLNVHGMLSLLQDRLSDYSLEWTISHTRRFPV